MKGFFFWELVIALVLISVVAVFSFTAFKPFAGKVKDQALREQLFQAIHTARHEARLRGVPVTVCQSDNQTDCSDHGQLLLMAGSSILQAFANLNIHGSLHWRSFQKASNYLTFLPNGIPKTGNGTYWYCAKKSKQPAWAIMLSKSGKSRVVRPDQFGNIIDSQGNALSC